jgi:hypothetical protein
MSTTRSRTVRSRSGTRCVEALGSKSGIARYGFLLPMDEARAQVAVDLSGRAFATFSGVFNREKVGGLPTELVPHFFRSLAESLGAAIHVSVTGENSHHMIEACFKGVGTCAASGPAMRGRRVAEHERDAVGPWRTCSSWTVAERISRRCNSLSSAGRAQSRLEECRRSRIRTPGDSAGCGFGAARHAASARLRSDRRPCCPHLPGARNLSWDAAPVSTSSDEGPCDAWAFCPGRCADWRPRPGGPSRTWAGISSWGCRMIRSSKASAAGDYVYFVHSFAVSVSAATLATTDYGAPLTAVARQGISGAPNFIPSAPPASGRASSEISCRCHRATDSRHRS